MHGYYYSGAFYGMWDSEDAAGMAAEQAGHYGYTPYILNIVNDSRTPPLGEGASAMAQFLALGQ